MDQKILRKSSQHRRTCQLLVVFSIVCSYLFFFVADCLAQYNYPLIDSSNFQYIGAFRLPQIKSDTGFSYGGSAMTYNPYRNSLVLVGHVNRQEVAEVLIPQDDSIIVTNQVSNLKIAKLAQNTRTVDITEKNLHKLGANGAIISSEVRIGGLLVLDANKLLGNAYAYYDASYKAKRSHFLSGLQSLSTKGDFRGFYTLGTINPGFVAGYMAHVPIEWQSVFGGSVVTGQFGLSIITRSSFGPALFAFNPNDLGSNPAPLRSLVYYPSNHPTLGEWDNTSEANIYFNMTSESGGVLFPDSTRSVLFIGSQGFGIPGYGQGTRDSTLDRTLVPGYSDVYYYYDPNRIYKGCHAYPYHYFVWAYNASELANVASGTLDPWSVVPYAVWTIPLPFTPPNARISIGGVGYDANRERVYICQKNADGSSERPIIHVFDLVLSGSSNNQSMFKDKTIPNDVKDSGSNIELNDNIY